LIINNQVRKKKFRREQKKIEIPRKLAVATAETGKFLAGYGWPGNKVPATIARVNSPAPVI